MKPPVAVIVALGMFGIAAARLSAQGPAPSPPADLNQLRDITGIEKPPAQPPAPTVPVWPWLLLALAAVSVPVVWFRLRRRAETPPPPPGRWAVAELDRIESERLPESGQVERFFTQLSDVVRRYLELRFQLPASRQTTPEFLQGMAASGLLDPSQQAALMQFLERCDLAKFARAGYSPAECYEAAAGARAFVGQTAGGVAPPAA